MEDITAVTKDPERNIMTTSIPQSIVSEFRLKENDRLSWEVADMDRQPVIVITPIKLERI